MTIDVLEPGSSRDAEAGDAPVPGRLLGPDGRWRQPGGGAFYSALQAARLGLRTLVLTRGNPRELEPLLEPYRSEIDVRIELSPSTTTFATSWRAHERRQRLLSWAGPIRDARLDTDILHLAAVAWETPARWRGPARFVGLTPQGLLRSLTAHGLVRLAAAGPLELPEQLDAVVISQSELAAWRGRADAAAPGLLAVTAGPRPTIVRLPGEEAFAVPMPTIAQPVEDLGAGDVFAAALFVSLHDGVSPTSAAAFAGAAAALRLEGKGVDGIGGRLAIARRARLSGTACSPTTVPRRFPL